MRRRPMVVAPGRMGRPGLLGTMARTAVVAGTATAVSDNVSRRGAQRADERAQYQAAQYQAAQSQAAQSQVPQQQAAATPGDTMSKIRELADMRSQGLLTDEEFAAAKAQVLGT
ncbi:MAG TPA: SHOCT domain-containing protein [Streptosporangiaceae bacterium]|nr:SHOCT domain-containing protein [Streptosporangiaceae bacterium]